MSTLTYQILKLLKSSPGLTDREITNSIRGTAEPQQPINQTARRLAANGVLARTKRADGLIGNYLADPDATLPKPEPESRRNHDMDALSEDEIKQALVEWLEADGWSCVVAWGRSPGIDVDAKRGDERWIIEVKGPGSRPQMRVNYFLGILGETLQRMDDPEAKYSIALPDLPQYRGLWERLPDLTKSRTTISMIFVTEAGKIRELN